MHQIKRNDINFCEHQRCPNCDRGERRIIELRECAQGEKHAVTVPLNEVVFLLSGRIRFTFLSCESGTAVGGDFYFLTPGNMQYEAEEPSRMLVVRLQKPLERLCGTFPTKRPKRGARYPEAEEYGKLHRLRINKPVQDWIDSMLWFTEIDVHCLILADLKVTELFILLHRLYPKRGLNRFLSPILSPDVAFSEFVRSNHHKYTTAAQLASAMNLSPATLSRKFYEVFGVSPHQWINRQRTEHIRKQLTESDKSLKEIAKEHHCTASGLYNFCMDNLGQSPSELRKSRGTEAPSA
jgi:AraC-like DNA-binding protein